MSTDVPTVSHHHGELGYTQIAASAHSQHDERSMLLRVPTNITYRLMPRQRCRPALQEAEPLSRLKLAFPKHQFGPIESRNLTSFARTPFFIIKLAWRLFLWFWKRLVACRKLLVSEVLDTSYFSADKCPLYEL